MKICTVFPKVSVWQILTTESKTSSLKLPPEATKDCAKTMFSLCCLEPRWCLRAQLDLDARAVLNGNGRSASVPSVCSPFHHLFWIKAAQCKRVWNCGKYWWVFFLKTQLATCSFPCYYIISDEVISARAIPWTDCFLVIWSGCLGRAWKFWRKKTDFVSHLEFIALFLLIHFRELSCRPIDPQSSCRYTCKCSNLHVQDSHT